MHIHNILQSDTHKMPGCAKTKEKSTAVKIISIIILYIFLKRGATHKMTWDLYETHTTSMDMNYNINNYGRHLLYYKTINFTSHTREAIVKYERSFGPLSDLLRLVRT